MKWACLAEMALGPHGHVASTVGEEFGGTGELSKVCMDLIPVARAVGARRAFQLSLQHTNGCPCLPDWMLYCFIDQLMAIASSIHRTNGSFKRYSLLCTEWPIIDHFAIVQVVNSFKQWIKWTAIRQKQLKRSTYLVGDNVGTSGLRTVRIL